MINKKILNNTLKELKSLLKASRGSTFTEIKRQLDKNYERISNRKDKSYNDIYNLAELIQAKTLAKRVIKIDKGMIVVLEIVEHPKAPNGIVFFYNEFINNDMGEVEIYTTKEIKE